MTTLVRSIRSFAPNIRPKSQGLTWRSLVVATLVAAVALLPGGWSIALEAMSEAYLAVAVFVAGTLALVSYAERGLKVDLGTWLNQHRHWQVPVAALLGAFPGCGGAIIAVTQYTKGYLSFGAVVATLIATMGDAIFLLLAREPQTALGVLVASMIVGIATGLIVDRAHGSAFLRPRTGFAQRCQTPNASEHSPRGLAVRDVVWLCLMFPGAVVGILAAFQIDVDAFRADGSGVEAAHWLGVGGAVLALAMWSVVGESRFSTNPGDVNCRRAQPSTLQKVIDTTNFVTSWVVFAFVGYELTVAVGGIDLADVFTVWAPAVPAMAILIGFIPGCGPQILVTSLYLSGSLPLSAQLGNAIANDGDALFPALAIAPKAAVVATLYSGLPATLVAYGCYWWAEGGAF